MISRSLKHISNAVTNPTNWFVAACFAVCLFSTMRLLDTRTISISQTADAAEVAADNSAHLQTNSELDAAKTLGLDSIVSSDGSLSASVKSKTVLTPIEELEVGMRVRADSPNGEFDDQFGTEVIPSEWRKLTLTSPKKNGTLSHITLLRPLDWIEREKAVVDGQVYITVPECGIDGIARIQSIEPCPPISNSEGQVVIGTFGHSVSGGFEISVSDQVRPIRCTPNHPIWSEDRQNFVRADMLGRGEQLRTPTGPAFVDSVQHAAGQTLVHNIEVLGTHVYYVGTRGHLVHNGGPCGEDKIWSIDELLDNGQKGTRNELLNRVQELEFPYKRGNFRENLAKICGLGGEGPAGYDAHHVFVQALEKTFRKAGIDIHDPAFGAWWKEQAHRSASAEYQSYWEDFFKQSRTKDEIISFAKSLSERFGFDWQY